MQVLDIPLAHQLASELEDLMRFQSAASRQSSEQFFLEVQLHASAQARVLMQAGLRLPLSVSCEPLRGALEGLVAAEIRERRVRLQRLGVKL